MMGVEGGSLLAGFFGWICSLMAASALALVLWVKSSSLVLES